MRILVVDDEIEIRRVLRLMLENAGYEVFEAQDGAGAVSAMRENRGVDLCIMDIMMPQMSGTEAAAEIRKFSAVPILFLTARSLDSDKEEAYSVGGDDYIVKPFAAKELLLKIEALTRRYNSYSVKDFDLVDGERFVGGVTLYSASRAVTKNGARVELRDKEIEVLIYLAKNRGRAVGASELYRAVWDEMPLPSSSNNITVHILNLRRKLEDDPASPKLIRTVWGKGYQVD
ncbi:MAG: response regulator transcription factor [Clostridia bacterium]|nr:response regulator transcription factor [Clostridia bacterium]